MIEAKFNMGTGLVPQSKHQKHSLAQPDMQIKDLGVKAGVVLNPATPLESIQHVIPQVDLILLMSGEGFCCTALQSERWHVLALHLCLRCIWRA